MLCRFDRINIIFFFKQGAVGALDGTLIHAVVPFEQQHLYRARGRGECYQNVLAICDFNMIFTYIVAGWQGTAHDARVLNEALVDPEADFPIAPSGIRVSNYNKKMMNEFMYIYDPPNMYSSFF